MEFDGETWSVTGFNSTVSIQGIKKKSLNMRGLWSPLGTKFDDLDLRLKIINSFDNAVIFHVNYSKPYTGTIQF